MAGRVAEIVRCVAGTDNIEAAAKAIRADTAKAVALTAGLEEIKREFLQLQLQDRQAERQAVVETRRIELDDRRRASEAMVGALGAEGWTARTVALGPAVVSVLVMLGFFVFTAWLVRDPPRDRDPTALTLLNVVVGSLVAGFTAVINFWLGSSQGSRDKDRAVMALQQAQATETVRQSRAAADRGFGSPASIPPPTPTGRCPACLAASTSACRWCSARRAASPMIRPIRAGRRRWASPSVRWRPGAAGR